MQDWLRIQGVNKKSWPQVKQGNRHRGEKQRIQIKSKELIVRKQVMKRMGLL